MTKQQQIRDAIKTAMAGLAGVVTLTANRVKPYAAADLPAINIIDGKSEVVSEIIDFTDERLQIAIEVFCKGITAKDAALDILSAALARIGADETLGGLVISAQKETRQSELKQDEEIIGVVAQTIAVLYRTNRWGI